MLVELFTIPSTTFWRSCVDSARTATPSTNGLLKISALILRPKLVLSNAKAMTASRKMLKKNGDNRQLCNTTTIVRNQCVSSSFTLTAIKLSLCRFSSILTSFSLQRFSELFSYHSQHREDYWKHWFWLSLRIAVTAGRTKFCHEYDTGVWNHNPPTFTQGLMDANSLKSRSCWVSPLTTFTGWCKIASTSVKKLNGYH